MPIAGVDGSALCPLLPPGSLQVVVGRKAERKEQGKPVCVTRM